MSKIEEENKYRLNEISVQIAFIDLHRKKYRNIWYIAIIAMPCQNETPMRHLFQP